MTAYFALTGFLSKRHFYKEVSGPIHRSFSEQEMDTTSQYYKEINRGFLDKAWRAGPDIGFELFYRLDKSEQEPKFLKFASYTPETRLKIRNLMESDNHQKLFIHESDLIRYYNDFLIDNLNDSMSKEEPFEKILKDGYQVAQMILREYFESIGSSKILRSLSDVIEIMQTCIALDKMASKDIFKITARENHHHDHCANTGLYNLFLGIKFKMETRQIKELGLGGMLFDIGKKTIPQPVLEKKGKLAPDEWQYIRKHPSSGKKVLNDMKCYSPNILSMAIEHHEKFDGSGYPFGLAGERISTVARICTISDVFNALVCKRDYRPSFTPFEALSEMKVKMKGQFDNRIFTDYIKAFAGT